MEETDRLKAILREMRAKGGKVCDDPACKHKECANSRWMWLAVDAALSGVEFHQWRGALKSKQYEEKYADRIQAQRLASRLRTGKRYNQLAARSRRTTGWVGAAVRRAKTNAKGRDFDLDGAFVRELYERQNGRCYWLNIPLKLVDEPRSPATPSLDRIDNNKGYTRDNVVLACLFANMGRSVLSAERFLAFLEENHLSKKD